MVQAAPSAKPREGGALARSHTARSLALLLVLSSLLATIVSGAVLSGGADPSSGSSVGLVTATSPAFPTTIQHVVVVFFENEPYSAVKADNGYLWSLTKNYSYASNYYSPCHPSSPNYLSATSDGTQGRCGSDASPPSGGFAVANLFSEAQTAGLSWANYAQSMPSACAKSDSQPFVVHHTPALYYSSVTGSASTCDSHVLPFSTTAALANASGFPQNYVFVTPDNNHNKPISASDTFAKSLISSMSTRSYWSSTVVFLVYDESATNDTTCPAGLDGISTTNCGGHIFLVAVGPSTAGVGAFATHSDQYSLFQTCAWLLDLPLGPTGTPMKSLFAATEPAQYTISGAVTYASNHTAVSGAQVTLAPGSTTTTGSAGQYSFSAENGSYTVLVAKAGLVAQSGGVTVAGKNVVQNFALDPFLYRVTGIVTNASSGTPIPGATVSVSGGPSTDTNSSGGYSLTLANGTYSVSASATGYTPATAPVAISGSSTSHGFALAPLAPGTYTLSGTVTYASNGSAVAGAQVALTLGSSMITGAGGEFSFSVTNGSYTLKVTMVGYVAQTVPLTITGSNLIKDVSLSPFTYLATGLVSNASSGEPIPGAEVAVAGGLAVTTDAAGKYSLTLANGTYSLAVSASGYQRTAGQISISGAPVTYDVSLAPNALSYAISGTVSAANNGTPISGAQVALNGDLPTETGPDGRYSILASNGEHLLTVSKPGFHFQAIQVAVNGNPVVQNFQLTVFQYGLTGRVLSAPESVPLRDANASASTSEWGLTNASGQYALLLPNGTYLITIQAELYQSATLSVTIDGAPAVAENVTLVPTPTTPGGPGGGVFLFTFQQWIIGVGVALGSALGLTIAWVIAQRHRAPRRAGRGHPRTAEPKRRREHYREPFRQPSPLNRQAYVGRPPPHRRGRIVSKATPSTDVSGVRG
jgi:hypothetical protein